VVESLQATASRPVQCSISQPDNGATIASILKVACTTLQSNNTSTVSTTHLVSAVGTMEGNGGIQLRHTTASMLVVVSTEVGQQSATTTREVPVEVVPVMCECANKVKTAARHQAWTNESLLVAEEEEDPVRAMMLTAAVVMRDGVDTVAAILQKTDTAMAGLVMVELNLLEVKGNGETTKTLATAQVSSDKEAPEDKMTPVAVAVDTMAAVALTTMLAEVVEATSEVEQRKVAECPTQITIVEPTDTKVSSLCESRDKPKFVKYSVNISTFSLLLHFFCVSFQYKISLNPSHRY